jgi:L-ascorbate metabolism protein UlaG (beta-lactamase superfamily)
MQIIYHGLSCFKIQGREAILITDPYDNRYGLKLPRLKADIVTISHDHPDHNNVKAIKSLEEKTGQPFIISGPGEYETKGVSIIGIPSYHDSKEGRERGSNVIYLITLDDLRICHLGDLGHILTDETLDLLGQVEILLIPVGGIFTLGTKEVGEVISQIEPRIVIPMHYKLPGLTLKLDPIGKFLKEIGLKEEKTDKLKITKKDLPKEGMRVVVLEV